MEETTAMRGWLATNGPVPGLVKAQITEALSGIGIQVGAADADGVTGPGVVIFDSVELGLLDYLREVSREGRERVLAVATSHSALVGRLSFQLLRAGASDVLTWDRSAVPAREVAARFERWCAVDRLILSPGIRENLIGCSAAWIAALRRAVEVARFTCSPILITGESGTGKELVARLIHALDSRGEKGTFVILDCTTIAPELAGSEFFGHERGAFTGAIAARDGAFSLADGGTLFLDEVGELPLTLQAELLRVVQEHTYKRVGSNLWQKTRFRLVCATNRDLHQEESRGRFRGDFYHRIASTTCHLPPLRERTEDILPMAKHFMAELRPGAEPPELDDEVRDVLLTREYPGNVRELKQLVARIIDRHVGPGPITVGDLPPEEWPLDEGGSPRRHNATLEQSIRLALAQGLRLEEIGRIAKEIAVQIVMSEEGGNLQRAARRLGVTDRTLQMRQAAYRQPRDSRPVKSLFLQPGPTPV